MKSFTYQSCNNEAVLSVKKEFKQNPNDSSIKSKYESLIGDTYIAIENIEEALNDLNELQKLKGMIYLLALNHKMQSEMAAFIGLIDNLSNLILSFQY